MDTDPGFWQRWRALSVFSDGCNSLACLLTITGTAAPQPKHGRSDSPARDIGWLYFNTTTCLIVLLMLSNGDWQLQQYGVEPLPEATDTLSTITFMLFASLIRKYSSLQFYPLPPFIIFAFVALSIVTPVHLPPSRADLLCMALWDTVLIDILLRCKLTFLWENSNMGGIAIPEKILAP